jgi:hypothetical protein
MKKQLLVLGCSQTKRETAGTLPAIDRYDGSSYRVLRSFLRKKEWPRNLSVAVLSAKYGLVGGFTGIENYDERMTLSRAAEWAPKCGDILDKWSESHESVHFSLGKDYLPAVKPAIERSNHLKTEIFEGPIGMKLKQIKEFLVKTESPIRYKPDLPSSGPTTAKYFLPDWDDLLDEHFDFETEEFSGRSPRERGDKHISILMKPKRMCDGILVSLAQHITSKGPLRKFLGTESGSLFPIDLRSQFGLDDTQSLFGDCGAFSYVNESEPGISVDQAAALYDLHGFNFGASVDHIPVSQIKVNGVVKVLSHKERKERVRVTKKNAFEFFEVSKKRNVSFTPVGIVQALTPKEYAATTKYYHEIGYQYIALGGLVPLPDLLIKDIVIEVMKMVEKLKPRPRVHLFGIFRPKLQELFRKLKIDSFDSATYFRKAWLRSDQNYLDAKGNWYAAIRVPMTEDGRTRKRLESEGLDIEKLRIQESRVMKLLNAYDRDEVSINEALDAVIEYDSQLTRSSEAQSMRERYKRTLTDKPWKKCGCPFCKEVGIHVLIFRGANRNKRRGAHNTLMLYNTLDNSL